MSGAAQVDPAVIAHVAQALARYGAAEEAVFAQVDRAIAAQTARVAQEQSRRRNELAHAQDVLAACQRQERADCTVPATAVRRAQARLDAAAQSKRTLDAAVARYRPAKTRHAATVQHLLLGARSHLTRKAAEIDSYLASGRGGGAGGGGAGGGGGGAGARSAAWTVGKALAREVGIPLAAELVGVRDQWHLDWVSEAESIAGDALREMHDSGAFSAMRGHAQASFDALGALLSNARSRHDG